MLYFILFLFITIGGYIGGKSLKNIYDKKIKTIQKINPKINYKDILYIMYMCIKMIIYGFITNIVQRQITSFCMNKINNNTYDITLSIKNKLITIRLEISRGPGDVLQILDVDTDNDVTEKILPYINYTVKEVTCKDLGYNHLQYYLSSGEVKQIEEKENIKLI